MLSGSYSARFDSSDRIKIPERFRSFIENRYGTDVFVTCLTNEAVQIYPWPVWENLTGFTTQGLLHLKPDLRKFKLHVNRRGSRHEIDSKGRVLIGQELKQRANLEEEVELIGLDDHLEVWDKKLLDTKLEENPLEDSDFERLAALPVKE